jgi:hypothetical protein
MRGEMKSILLIVEKYTSDKSQQIRPNSINLSACNSSSKLSRCGVTATVT